MIPRYSLPEMAAVWSDEARLGHWLEIEILAVEAWAELGTIPAEDARGDPRTRRVHRRARAGASKQVTRHDVAAFVQVVGEPRSGPRAAGSISA